jgi:glycosyltransferase involved in cell wall biosynthesis
MTPAEPVFSVILPTYNRAHILMDAVNSVLAQTLSEFEFLIVDDHSTDDTRAVLARIDDPRVTVLTNRRPRGNPAARNTAIAVARGSWICQIDSDDLWPPDWLERMAAAISDAPADVGIVYGSIADLNTRSGRVDRVRKAVRAGRVHEQMLEVHFMGHWAAAIRTLAIREVGGYDESFRQQADHDLLLRLTERHAVLPVPDAVYVKRLGDGDRVMLDGRGGLVAKQQLFAKHARELARVPRARYQQLSDILSLAAWDGEWWLVARVWLQILPASWRAPTVFLRTNQFLATLAEDAVKRSYWRSRHALGQQVRSRL